MTTTECPYEISAAPERLQLEWVIRTLRDTYWGAQRSEAALRRGLASSYCFGAYARAGGQQVGFARVVSDGATFAWLCDVVVDPAHRRRGLGKRLVEAVLQDSRLADVTFHLATQDAHGLYALYGFKVQETMRRGRAPGAAAL